MIHYADTSFLCSIYRKQDHTDRALSIRTKFREPLHFTQLLEYEFIQAIEFQVWLHGKDRSRGYSRKEANGMATAWDSDVASGVNLLAPVNADAVLGLARSFALQKTASGGHRTVDIMHVATAVHLGAKKFLTFDARQRVLAEYAGLEVVG